VAERSRAYNLWNRVSAHCDTGRTSVILGRGLSRGSWFLGALVALGCLAPGTVSAQEWFELYAEGGAALRNGQARRAVELLRRAIQERPEPGRNVPTYGTNFEPRYFPYLRLAEAYLLLEAGEDARQALETSARFGVEPVEERKALEARVRAALDAKSPPPAATPPPVALPTPAPVMAPVIALPSPSPLAPPPTSTEVEPTTRPSGPVGAESTARPPPHGTAAALEVTSDPPEAQVFLDDEPRGRTDPHTGRLKLRGLAPGRHRVRLSAEGRDDLIREIDVSGESVVFHGVLPHRQTTSLPTPPAESPATPWPPWTLVGLVLFLLLLLGLWVRSLARLPTAPAVPTAITSPRANRSDPGAAEVLPISFGDYSLVRRIGKGGMAVVYEAVRRGESFALKRPLAGFLDDTRFRERFLREAELGRTLHHPNIIRIFDRGQVGAVPYFTMELIQGETLRECLDREGRLDTMLAARVTARVAEALDYAHNKGVIHRDLKPSNIMLERSGGVKVMDYGIARAQHLEGLTTTGSFLGTPSYSAPETVEGSSQPSSDVYSLGVVLFEMLTGSLPFRGENAFAVLRSHCTAPPPVPSSLNYALSPVLDRIVLRLLSKESAERPTAEELLNELSDYLAESR
jgi:protein kinase-like protein/PEGA domain-containing protein